MDDSGSSADCRLISQEQLYKEVDSIYTGFTRSGSNSSTSTALKLLSKDIHLATGASFCTSSMASPDIRTPRLLFRVAPSSGKSRIESSCGCILKPVRMWQHGICSFFGAPSSVSTRTSGILPCVYFPGLPMITFLYETVPGFECNFG